MVLKHGFAYLVLVLVASLALPGQAATINDIDTTIGAIEVKLFSHSHPGDSDSIRLGRLENFVFGTPDTDRSLHDRVTRLSSCVAVKSNSSVHYAAHSSAPVKDASPNLAVQTGVPRVTRLELSLLGKSYFGEPIGERLSRLEWNEFGNVCTSTNLAARIDTLEAVATSNAEKTKVNELVSYQSPTSLIYDYRKYVHGLFQNNLSAPGKEQINTVVDQIEYLESTAFGKIHHNKPLEKRVGALEERYYGAPQDDDRSLTHRVAKLLSLVNSGSTKSGIAHG